ncbi:hypothetical protein [Shewanella waksmanii]|uniref:hypothetical protein n=1 Tax=Shewanella waksmanii TaxID=213783 RepID=UPI0037364F95
MTRLINVTLTSALLLTASQAYAQTSSIAVDDVHSKPTIELDQQQDVQILLDLGWDSKYISEGRNNLENGGIYWGMAAIEYDNINLYTKVGRGDTDAYTEWNFGLEYGLAISNNLEATIGYQRVEIYADERESDNELFADITYTKFNWLIPSLAYTYSTEAGGYFIEASLHSNWQLTDTLVITPYVTQAFDFQYATEDHNGPNHFQFGIEAQWQLNDTLAISGHISHTIAQQDIKQELATDNLDETFAGIHFSFNF